MVDRKSIKASFWSAIFGVVLCAGGPVLAEESGVSELRERETANWLRGTSVVVRNELTLISLDRSAELTWNPQYVTSLSLRPRIWFGEQFSVRAQLDAIREITEADETTYGQETLLSDLTLVFGFNRLVQIPWVLVDLDAELGFSFPTSKASQGRTFLLGMGPTLRLSRRFDLLEGLLVGYQVRSSALLHRYTTGELGAPLIPGCTDLLGGCDAFLNTGLRNPAWRIAHGAFASFQMLEWLGVSASLGQIVDFLYPLGEMPQGSFQPLDPTDQRHLVIFELEVNARPMPSLEVALGLASLAPELTPDSGRENPIANRYSAVFLDLRFSIDGLIAQISE